MKKKEEVFGIEVEINYIRIMSYVHIDCPNCDDELVVKLPRWDSKFICPNCKAFIYNDYDLIYNEETSDELDITSLRVISEKEFNDKEGIDFVECEKIVD